MSAANRAPYLGEDVHWFSYTSDDGKFTERCMAAKITRLPEDGLVMLTVFNPTGILYWESGYCEEHVSGTWHYAH